ncbi:SDR family oxidoreductase [Steroidobacter sp.]|uniref:SDR family oxidoreductase n=1 Tax=Steroidobacter sp. TaxID=1978227 RepID=UPI0025F3F537|nr:SDR family NAD(P)-dependent oxidoreductase [Steroidobacter sp.]
MQHQQQNRGTEFHGRVALVTGAAQGMGFAMACRLAAAGARVAMNDSNATALAAAVADLRQQGADALAIPADVTIETEVRRMFATVLEQFGALDILINNAGVLRPTRCEQIATQEWDLVLDTNLKGTFLCCREAIPLLRRSEAGRIVNLSSTAGKSVSTIGGAHYTAAKAGVLGLTRHLAKELGHERITVNAVCPGLIDTEMVRGTIAAASIAAYASSFPLQRLGEPAEIAELVAFLASDRAAYITGASLDINGGDLTI